MEQSTRNYVRDCEQADVNFAPGSAEASSPNLCVAKGVGQTSPRTVDRNAATGTTHPHTACDRTPVNVSSSHAAFFGALNILHTLEAFGDMEKLKEEDHISTVASAANAV